MRIAVLSDVHANLVALDAVLAALRPFDALWHLGDVVGYGPHPDEVVDRLRSAGALGVCGNHDAAAVGRIDTDLFNTDARIAIEWTARRIEPSTRRWLEELPERREEGDFSLVHGSPRDPIWEYVYSTQVARASLAAFSTPYCLVGHTHVPLVFRADGERIQELGPGEDGGLTLDSRRALVNPGSVGQPRDRDPRAAGMTIDTERRTVTWHRITYDIARTQEAMRQVGLPGRLVERLSFGV